MGAHIEEQVGFPVDVDAYPFTGPASGGDKDEITGWDTEDQRDDIRYALEHVLWANACRDGFDRDAAHATMSPRRDAERAAKALDEALRGGGHAEAMQLYGLWYVVTSGTGEGVDYAYDADAVDVGDVSRWDYSAWCATISPCEDLAVAVADYVDSEGRLLGTAGTCRPILTDDQIDVLRICASWLDRT